MAKRCTLHSPKLQHYWNLTIRLFCIISRTLVEAGVLPLCRCAVGVFYSPSRLGNILFSAMGKLSSKSHEIWITPTSHFMKLNNQNYLKLSWNNTDQIYSKKSPWASTSASRHLWKFLPAFSMLSFFKRINAAVIFLPSVNVCCYSAVFNRSLNHTPHEWDCSQEN